MPAPPWNSSDKQYRLPQFCLRSLFLLVAICGVLFAVLAAIGFVASIAMVIVLSIVCLHVLGNVLGRKLREQSARQSLWTKYVTPQTDQPVVGPRLELAQSRLT